MFDILKPRPTPKDPGGRVRFGDLFGYPGATDVWRMCRGAGALATLVISLFLHTYWSMAYVVFVLPPMYFISSGLFYLSFSWIFLTMGRRTPKP
jgi:hypothetical protein